MSDQTDHLVGSQLGKYIVVEVLGSGGMGVVLRAEHEETGEVVAIKLLANQLVSDGVSKERMEREARALSQLKHPNIVEIFGFDILDNGRAYLVMEFVQGETLDIFVDRHKVAPLDLVVNVAMQLANAMQVAHDAGVLHRDLKPSNVMLAKEDGRLNIKVFDFGVAQLADSDRRLTRTGEVVGSPLFMSPEQCQGKPLDNRSDIYSYGIIMFYCLTGRYPHKGSTLRDTFVLKTTKPCPPIRKYNPKFDGPQELEKLIYKCLEIEPKKRYASMGDIYIELIKLANKHNYDTSGHKRYDGAILPATSNSTASRQSASSKASAHSSASMSEAGSTFDRGIKKMRELGSSSPFASLSKQKIVFIVCGSIVVFAVLGTGAFILTSGMQRDKAAKDSASNQSTIEPLNQNSSQTSNRFGKVEAVKPVGGTIEDVEDPYGIKKNVLGAEWQKRKKEEISSKMKKILDESNARMKAISYPGKKSGSSPKSNQSVSPGHGPGRSTIPDALPASRSSTGPGSASLSSGGLQYETPQLAPSINGPGSQRTSSAQAPKLAPSRSNSIRRGAYNPSSTEEHDVWWNYRLKKEN